MKTKRTFLALATLLILGSSCGLLSSGGNHIRIKALVTPEDAKAALGDDVGPVGHDSLPELENKGEGSFSSNLKFTTTGTIKREISIQVQAWATRQDLADQYYDAQSMVFIERIEGGTIRTKVEGVGDMAEGFTTEKKNLTALVLKRGKIVMILKVTGGVAPDDQIKKLQDLSNKILAQIQPF